MAALQEKWEACKQEDKNLEGLCSPITKHNYDHLIHFTSFCVAIYFWMQQMSITQLTLTSNFLLHTGYLFNTLQEGNIGLIFPFIVIQTSLLQHSNDDYDLLLGFLDESALRKFLSILYTGPLRKTLYYCCYILAEAQYKVCWHRVKNACSKHFQYSISLKSLEYFVNISLLFLYRHAN